MEGDSELTSLISKGSAVSVGSFDGPHKGHEALFDKVLSYSKLHNLSAGIITFSEPLGSIFKSNIYKGNISTLEQRIEYFANKGFDFILVIDFSPEFGKIEWYSFLSMLKERLNMCYLAEGNNFHCGYKGRAGVTEIEGFSQENNFLFEVAEPVFYHGLQISSSRIRNSIFSGQILQAADMLGHVYTIDCSNIEWKRKECFFYPIGGIRQVFPEKGTFKVNIVLQEKKYEAFFLIEADYLRLKVSDKNCYRTIQAIEFING